MNSELIKTDLEFIFLKKRVVCIFLVFFSFLIYFNSLFGEFLRDDFFLIVNNPNIRHWSFITQIFQDTLGSEAGSPSLFYRPIQMLTYMFDYSFWKFSAHGYHLTNIIIHAISSMIVYLFIRKITCNNLLGLLTSFIFLIHPTHTETVAFISGRADSLSTAFLVTTLYCYLKHIERPNMLCYIIAIACYVLALLSKEHSLIVVALIPLISFSLRKKININLYTPILSITIIYCANRLVSGSGRIPIELTHTPIHLLERIPGFFVAFLSYLKLSFFPHPLHMDYGMRLFYFHNPLFALGLALFIILIFLGIKIRQHSPVMSFAILWYCITIIPASIFPYNAYMAEHWLYIPLIGFGLFTALIITKSLQDTRTQWIGLIILSIITIAFSVKTVRQNTYWKNSVTHLEQTLYHVPDNVETIMHLGLQYLVANQPHKTRKLYMEAIMHHKPSPSNYRLLGRMYLLLGKYDKSIELYKKAIEQTPWTFEPHFYIATAYVKTNQVSLALKHYLVIIKTRPNHVPSLTNAANIYSLIKEYDKSLDLFHRALEHSPKDIKILNNIANTYKSLGKHEKAIRYYTKALSINPYMTIIKYNLATLYFDMKKYDLAIKYYDEAVADGYADDAGFEAMLNPYRSFQEKRPTA